LNKPINILNENKKRLLIISYFLTFAMLLITVRLFYVTVIKKDKSSGRVRFLGSPLRGIIFDRNNFRLAISLKRYSVAIRPNSIRTNIDIFGKEILPLLSKATGKTPREIVNVIKKHWGPKLVYLARKINLEVSYINKLSNIRGIYVFKEYDRRYPYKNLACQVIGITGKNDRGLEGIEYHFEDVLRQKGNILGADIVLSIDRDIQSVVEEELSKRIMLRDAASGSVIIMNAKNGDILAMANNPDYNLQEYRKLTRKEFLKRSKNLCVTSSDEIGSAFKAFTIAMLADENLIDFNKKYDCRGFYQVPGGKIINDTGVFGKITFGEVVKHSSNVGMIEAAMTMRKKHHYMYLKNFGFTEKTGIELPYENTRVFRSYDLFRNQARASVAIGQEIGVTPVQVVSAAAAVVNGGYVMRPRIVLKILRAGEAVKKFKAVNRRKVISAEAGKVVWKLLRKVMERGGTGYNANVYINGKRLDIVGKTGTAQVYDARLGAYSESLRNASFLGFIKRPRNTYVVFVIVRRPARDSVSAAGSTVAVPLFRDIVAKILDRYGSRLP
jgi:cell division protein FtsI (penicillin-binding protein 3)